MSRGGNRNHVVLPQIDHKKTSMTDFQNENYNFIPKDKKKAVVFKDVKEDDSQVEDLKRKVEELRRDVEQRNQTIFSIQRNFESLSTILKNEKLENQTMRDEFQRQKDSNLELLKRIGQQTQRIQDLESLADGQRKEIAIGIDKERKLIAEEKDRLAKLQQLQSQIEDYRGQVKQLQNQLKNIEQSKHDYKDQIQQVNEQLNNAQQSLKKMIEELQEAREALRITQKNAEDKTIRIKELEQNLQNIQSLYQESEKQLHGATTKHQNMIKQMKQDLETKTTQFFSVNKQLQIAEQTIEQLKEQIALTSYTNQSETQAIIMSKDETIQSLKKEIVDITENIDILKGRINELKSLNEAQAETVRIVEQKMKFKDDKIVVQEEEIQQITNQLKQLTAIGQVKDKQIENYKRDLEALHKLLEEFKQNSAENMSMTDRALHQSRLEYESKIKVLKQKEKDSEKLIDKLTDQIEDLKINLDSTQRRLIEKEKDFELKSTQVETLQNQFDDSERLRAQLHQDIKELKTQIDQAGNSKMAQLEECEAIIKQQKLEIEYHKDQAMKQSEKSKSLLEQADSWKEKNDQLIREIEDVKRSSQIMDIENDKKLKQIQSEMDKQGVTLNSIQREQKQKDDQIYQYSQTIKTLNGKIQGLQNEMESLDVKKIQQQQQEMQQREMAFNNIIQKISHALESTITSISCSQCMETVQSAVTCIPCGHTFCQKCPQGYKDGCAECGKGDDNFRNKLLDDIIAKVIYSQQTLKNMK